MRDSSLIDRIEEMVIAVIFWLMTALTFANVVARYVFNANILWALELTVYLFAWMVLLGASYAVKRNAHLGVDLLVNHLAPMPRRLLGLFSVGVCVIFGCLMLKGAWDYWANFANLPQTTGHWFSTGFQSDFLGKGWYEVNDIPMPYVLSWLSAVFNEGEAYEKIPRLLPYLVLPISMLLLLWRFLQAAWRIWTGRADRVVASHEVEDELDKLAAQSAGSQRGGAD